MLRVLVIDELEARAGEICAGLALAGHQVAALLPTAADLTRRVEEIGPDVILIQTDAPSRDTLEHLAVINAAAPRPVVMFAKNRDGRVMRKAFKAGVSAYVVDGLTPGRLAPVIDVAIARFEEHQELRRERDVATQALAERKTIDRAKGVLMKARGMDEQAAYAALRKLAMDRGQTLGRAAADVVEMAKVLL
ncbi:ANTAR domain-containing response regulator [Sulfurisoma sediminicola]|jgi:two-component system, response regulator / RNA-binding antiterminator|uniref:Response regulator receiver and ANTAR domain protein n=1 Tax=Sulfurisoma sediminicola TaxID=1381557 RepID=A0A497XPC0_9PROT|nr:ANTAR domain-containing protein [Sulfurisoma sediminicola]RLJ68218.1 response regulator receiver and ANTAR domain protein [Sulfurisoma sediminicola]